MGMGGQHDPVRFGFRPQVYALWTATFAEWKPAEGQIRSPLHARRDRPNGVIHVRFTRTHRPVWRGPPSEVTGNALGQTRATACRTHAFSLPPSTTSSHSQRAEPPLPRLSAGQGPCAQCANEA